MKNMKLILLIAALTSNGLLRAQIPNAGFEIWRSHTRENVVFNDPVGWYSQNFLMIGWGKSESVTATTDAYAGVNALRLRNLANDRNEVARVSSVDIGSVTGRNKFSLEGIKPIALKGYYKYSYAQGDQDSFMIVVGVYKEGELVGRGRWRSGLFVSAYTAFEIPVTYSNAHQTVIPDSAAITIFAGSLGGGALHTSVELFIDELSFTAAPTGVNEVAHQRLDASIYPNPIRGDVTIQYDQNEDGPVQIELIDLTGKCMEIVYAAPASIPGNKTVNWNTDHLRSGMYMLRIAAGSSFKTIKVVVQ